MMEFENRNRFRSVTLKLIAAVTLLFPLLSSGKTPESHSSFQHRERSCYQALHDLGYQRLGGKNDHLTYFAGTNVPMARAMEKEGLHFTDIAPWWDSIDKPTAEKALNTRFIRETGQSRRGVLRQFLSEYSTQYRAKGVAMPPKQWANLTEREQLDFILSHPNPLSVINEKGIDELFVEGVLNYDSLRPSAKTPSFITVGNDSGSYEVRSVNGEVDRSIYQEQRDQVEKVLDGRVGHQHTIHGWPESKTERARVAPHYIELLDAATWYLFWRQVKRNPEDAESVLPHKYLGLYTRASLDRLERAMLSGDASKFKNKYRMIGARSIKGRDTTPGQEVGKFYPDFERRSGNKGIKRDFIEDMIEARFLSGDYEGLQSIHDYEFDPSTPLRALIGERLTKKERKRLLEFEAVFKPLNFVDHSLAHNHIRNKLIAPLLPWTERLPIGHKSEILERAQQRYAEGLAKIGKKYLKKQQKIVKSGSRGDLEKLNYKTFKKIERLAFLFADRVRLDEDFERYLIPTPKAEDLPQITVKPTGPIDPNNIDLGIEYSFRFPDKPRGYAPAKKEIKKSAVALSQAMGGSEPEEMSSQGHGHNIGIKYIFKDPLGQDWRVEWDGINRTYVNGAPINPRSGHIEIPSPRWAPKDPSQIITLYQTMRSLGNFARRGAGGAHANVDLTPIISLPNNEGPRKVADLLLTFEENRAMTQFLWQHPFRLRSAIPVDFSPELGKDLAEFNGTSRDLALLLYGRKYLNPFVTRKPSYTQLNATAVMAEVVPKDYQKAIDIKNPETTWFPAFGGKGTDRLEFRLFDAPTSEYTAALQMKYVRALLDKALNGQRTPAFQPRYTNADVENWKTDSKIYLHAAEEHLRFLGLDPVEFRPIISEAFNIQQAKPSKRETPIFYPKFLPAQPGEATVQ